MRENDFYDEGVSMLEELFLPDEPYDKVVNLDVKERNPNRYTDKHGFVLKSNLLDGKRGNNINWDALLVSNRDNYDIYDYVEYLEKQKEITACMEEKLKRNEQRAWKKAKGRHKRYNIQKEIRWGC